MGLSVSREECDACKDAQGAYRDALSTRIDQACLRLDSLERLVAGAARFDEFVALRNNLKDLEVRMEVVTTAIATARGGFWVITAIIGVAGPILGAMVAKIMGL